jgi:hypothetical protein
MHISVFYFSKGVFPTDASRDWTLSLYPALMVFVTKSYDMKCSSKQSAIVLTLSFGRCIIPKGPRTAICAFCTSLFIRDFALGHRARGVTSQFPTFVSHLSSIILWYCRPYYQPLHMLDSGLLATVSLRPSYILVDSPDQVDPYLLPRV